MNTVPISENRPILKSLAAGAHYWLQKEPEGNFGDFFAEWLFEKVFAENPNVHSTNFVVGSVVNGYIIDAFLQQPIRPPADGELPSIGYWACGLREPIGLDPGRMSQVGFYGIRGILSRELLELPKETPIGDSALLLPALHQPLPNDLTAGRSICVPHFMDPLTSEQIMERTGADLVLSPRIEGSVEAFERLVAQIASARAVLAGSLHAAIVACAYGVPFSFYNSGYIDCPFKWLDFASSIGHHGTFVSSFAGHESAHHPARYPMPPMLPLIDCAPFVLRPGIRDRVSEFDAKNQGYGV